MIANNPFWVWLRWLPQEQLISPATKFICSLGAHGAGYAGKTLKKANVILARITGLDPAGPYFTGMGAEVSLNPGDAAFVDTIVTDGGNLPYLAFGSYMQGGHVNFLPNGGLDQLGCSSRLWSPGTAIFHGGTIDTSSFGAFGCSNIKNVSLPIPLFIPDVWGKITTFGLEGVSCNHARSVVLFYGSINKKACKVTGSECSDYKKFLRGECSDCTKNRCAVMGWNVDPSLKQPTRSRKFFAVTTPTSPFCNAPLPPMKTSPLGRLFHF